MKAIAEAIRTKLQSSSDLTDLLSDGAAGVYMDPAPPSAQRPYVIYMKSSGNKDWQFGDGFMQWDKWTVKGVGTQSQAMAIDAACQAVLTKADLGIPGQPTAMLQPFTDVAYPEVKDGEQIRHVGAVYTIVVEKG